MAGKRNIIEGALGALTDALPEGIFSPVSDAVGGLSQQKGTGDQMLNMISKSPGIREAELKETGLGQYLSGQESVTKAEIEDFLSTSRTPIEERVFEVSPGVYPSSEEGLFELIGDATSNENLWNKVVGDRGPKWSEFASVRNIPQESDDAYMARMDWLSENNAYLADDYIRSAKNSGPRHDDPLYSLTPVDGERKGYKEIIFKTPVETEAFPITKRDIERGFYADDFGRTTSVKPSDIGGTKELYAKDTYFSDHWEDPNVFAHARFSNHTLKDGDNTVFIDEIQSDLHQAAAQARENQARYISEENNISIEEARKMLPEDAGYEETMERALPDLPLKKNWHELAFRRVVQEAVEQGKDSVSWTPADMQLERYPSVAGKIEDGMRAFYDNKLVNYAKKFGKKFGAKVGKKEVEHEFSRPQRWIRESVPSTASIPRTSEVWNMPITEKMRKSILEKGIPLYTTGAVSVGALENLVDDE